MQTYTRLWLVESYSYWTECPFVYNHGERFPPDTFHYLCPKCGRVWARTGPLNPEHGTTHHPLRCPCPKHAHAGLANLEVPFRPDINESIPMPYLADTFLEHARCVLKRSISS